MVHDIIAYLQIFNTLLTILLNLSPIVIFIPVIKSRQSYTNIPFMMLFFNLLNCVCWDCYWYRRMYIFPIICNSICWAISSIFFFIYLYYLSKKSLKKYFAFMMILALIETAIIFISSYVINLKIFGKILIVINVLMFVAPGQNILRVIKEKNYRLIPIVTTIISIICTGGWLVFGKIVNDINCIIANSLGLICSLFTSFIWLYYYLRAKIKKNKNKFYPEENSNDYNVEIK